MKKRITALALVLLICLAYCGSALAAEPRGALVCQSNVKNGDSYAKLTCGTTESLYISFTVYKIEGNSEEYQCSASKSATGMTVTASSTKTLSSGKYVMYIYGYGNTVTINEARYYTI